MKYLVAIFFLWGLDGQAQSARVQSLTGKASQGANLIYTEDHTVQLNEAGRVVDTATVYKDPSGKVIAELRSDFAKSLSAPAHDFKDLRFNLRYGIRYEGEKLVMYSQEGSEAEQTKAISADGKDSLLVGCQGLAYYFGDHLEDLKKSKVVPIQFLIPGKLETYKFELQYKSTDAAGLAVFEIHIKNWFLRLFAPKLVLHYDTINKRLTKYDGLSNLYDGKKEMQNVNIEYSYPK